MNKSLLKTNQYKETLKLWITIFLSLNLVFFYYTSHNFIGNHDWDWVKGTHQILSLNTGLFEARFAKFILNVILFDGQIFPLLNTIFSFILLSLGIVILISYWQIKGNTSKIIIGLSISLAPYILGWLYFPINILGNFSAILFVALGLKLCQKNKKKYILLSIILYILALGVYPSTMEMMLICASFYHLLNNKKKLQQIFQDFFIVIIALMFFKFLLYVLIKYNLVYANYYNLQTIDFIEAFNRIPVTINLIFKQLIYTLPFFPFFLKLVGGCIILLAIFNTKLSIKNITLWGIILSSSVISAFISVSQAEVSFQPRINYYSITYIYAGSLAILLNNKQSLKNIGYFLGISLICLFIKENIYAQKVWFLGKNAEEKMVERMIKRIEERANNYPLIPVMTSEISLRPKYYNEKYQISSSYILESSFMVRHIPSGMFNFYYPTQLFYSYSQISEISNELYNYLKTSINPWPHENGLFVDNKYVVINSTKEGIEAIKKQLPK